VCEVNSGKDQSVRPDEYVKHDAVGLAELIANGSASAPEVLEAAIEQAESVNGALNAINFPMFEEARRRAASPLSGPFAGVPFLIKDLRQDYRGMPTSQGSAAWRNIPAARHAEVVRRWLASGLLIFGKTNTPEFGAKPVTEPTAFGATRNPWDTQRSPGGSSGGSAAAVAAGIVPAAGATDGGGSIRIPASYCGLVGLKPGRGRVPEGPNAGELLHGCSVHGVLTRTVRDAAALLDVMAGPDPQGAVPIAPPERPYREEVGHDPGRLRIGFTTRPPTPGATVSPDAVAAVVNTARLLTELGHDVVEDAPTYDGSRFLTDFLEIWYARLGASLTEAKRATGCDDRVFELMTRIQAAIGRSRSAADYSLAHNRWHDYVSALADFHCRCDLLLTPTVPTEALRLGEFDLPVMLKPVMRAMLATHTERLMTIVGQRASNRQAQRLFAKIPFTTLANVTGRPAISLPLHWTTGGLPLGVQFVAPPAGEGTLLKLASQLEVATPWAHRRPPTTKPDPTG
jgi:amidase